jgi:hypothetical protein
MTLVPGVLSVIAMMIALIVAVPGFGNDASRCKGNQPHQDAAFHDVLEIFHGQISDAAHSLILTEAGAAIRGVPSEIAVGFLGDWCRRPSYRVADDERGAYRFIPSMAFLSTANAAS